MTESGHRLPRGGRIDRTRPLRFTYDGASYRGCAGDTLASALLANGVHLVGWSFKYHRPRGIFSAGAEEPNALVQLGVGVRTEPNIRATQIELSEGLVASSQNCWPSVGFDVGAVNSLLAPLFPAGFYYKTFMWPPSFWHLYERMIRRMAGLGKAPREADPDRYEQIHAHCDVLVAGGGPAGLMAALAAASSGARVILADEQSELGGSLLWERVEHAAARWLKETASALARMPELRVLTRTTVAGYYDHNYLTLLERVGDHRGPNAPPDLPRQRLWKVRAKQVALATGAIERPLVFAGNDRPGVMLAGAARAYVNRYGVRPGRRAIVFTNNDGAHQTAFDLHDAGIVVTVVDLRPEGPAAGIALRAKERAVRVLVGHGIAGTRGGQRIRSVEARPLAPSGDAFEDGSELIECDLLCVSGGWVPSLHLHSQARGRPRFDAERGIFLPGEAVQAERSAGACAGTFGLNACLRQGADVGAAAAQAAGFTAPVPHAPPFDEPDEAPLRPLFHMPGAGQPRAKAFVDLQNDVTAADIGLALREGYRSIEHVKRYTTTGMGTDQGKTGNLNALAIVSKITGQPIPEIGATTFRPPYTPVTFGAIVGRNCKQLFDPARRTPMHEWHEANGAVFEDVGLWKRPRYYPRDGESMHEAVSREVKAARTSIGVLDASTLGKIDIQGRDAAELLNRVYTNAWSKLDIGRARYGLMLGEDGMVFDDGVTARLGEQHYLMSTTSGGAVRVLARLEEWLQTEWPELAVFCTSVTEQWATISLCGPNCRKLVAELVPDLDLDRERFPHMSVREASVLGVPARVFRISFTGELGYEIQVPASYGLPVWEAVVAAGARHDITPYGTETMHVLRAEKGYIIAGQDTDGTITPHDLGMDWIVSKRKPDFIGQRSLARADLARPDRKQLVGLLTDDPKEVLEEGAHLVADPDQPIPMTMLGHVTSSYMSPNLGRSFALALVKEGRSRMGHKLYVPMEGRAIPVTVSDSVFLDKDGERLRA